MRARAAIAALLFALPAAAGAQERYIPLELILGAPWDGREILAHPEGVFDEKVRDGSVWIGPRDWRHPATGETMKVYDRSRGRRTKVDQIFAVRRDASAIGRVADSRFGIDSCDQEAKFPLGKWRQDEARAFEYPCWYGTNRRLRRSVIHVLRIDFDCGVPHCLEIRWTHSDPVSTRVTDMRRYVFAPGRGLVEFH